MNLALICNRCPHRSPPPYAGRMDCLYDGKPVDTQERLQKAFCPAGRFPTGAFVTPPLPKPPDEEIEATLKAGDPGGCNC